MTGWQRTRDAGIPGIWDTDGLLSVLCPVADDNDLAGANMFDASAEEAAHPHGQGSRRAGQRPELASTVHL
jgi:hypothetical protein